MCNVYIFRPLWNSLVCFKFKKSIICLFIFFVKSIIYIQGVYKVLIQFQNFFIKSIHDTMQDITDFKQRISNAIATIDEDMLQRTWQKIEYRLDVLRLTNGAHTEMY